MGIPLFLVERYLPHADAATLAALEARLAAAIETMRGEGREVTWLQSVAIPADETCLCLFRAQARELVAEANARAGADYERISEALVAGEL
jgi:uncharacterized protein DUF4242